MKIGLVVPDFLSGTSFLQQPLDFLYTASVLEGKGHEVIVVDCRINHLSMVNTINKLKSVDLIIVTSTPCDQVQNYFVDFRYSYVVYTVNYIKKFLPNTTLVLSGAHSTVRPNLVLNEMNVDILIVGEVVYTALFIADSIQNHISLDTIPNIVYRFEDKYISTHVNSELKHPILPIDLLPAYDKVNMAAYFGVQYKNNVPIRKLNRAVVQGGRGCPYSCAFCHKFYGDSINRRPPEVVAEELEICANKYGVKEIFFLDEVFTMDTKWVVDLCEIVLKKGIELEFTIQTRLDCINKELLDLMYRAGVKNIWVGIESADNEVLQISKKGIDGIDFSGKIEMIKNANINPHAFFMLGMAGETVNSLNKTLRTIHENKIPYTRSVMICTPRYDTDYYKLALKEYPDLEDHWFNLNAVKGLVANEMTPEILQKAKRILKDRDFLYKSKVPQL